MKIDEDLPAPTPDVDGVFYGVFLGDDGRGYNPDADAIGDLDHVIVDEDLD